MLALIELQILNIFKVITELLPLGKHSNIRVARAALVRPAPDRGANRQLDEARQYFTDGLVEINRGP